MVVDPDIIISDSKETISVLTANLPKGSGYDSKTNFSLKGKSLCVFRSLLTVFTTIFGEIAT